MPSELGTREFVVNIVKVIAQDFGSGSYCSAILERRAEALANSYTTDISHVSDRLGSILRLDPPDRPTVNIGGVEIAPHMIIGATLSFENETERLFLFPMG